MLYAGNVISPDKEPPVEAGTAQILIMPRYTTRQLTPNK
jgi:hypothetical protein